MSTTPRKETAVQLVAAERHRQITKEGYTMEHDTGAYSNNDGLTIKPELALAGVAYALHVIYNGSNPIFYRNLWPWDKDQFKPSGDRVRDLIKAAALICAQIDLENGVDGADAPSPASVWESTVTDQSNEILRLHQELGKVQAKLNTSQQTNAALTADRKRMEAEIQRLKAIVDLRVGPVDARTISHQAMADSEVHRACNRRELELTANPLEMKVTAKYWSDKYHELKRLHELESKTAADQVASLQKKLELASRDVCASEAPQLVNERDELQRWKQEMLQVLSNLNLQEIGKVLGMPLGIDVSKNILPYIHSLKARLEGAEARARQEAEECAANKRRLDTANSLLNDVRYSLDGKVFKTEYDIVFKIQDLVAKSRILSDIKKSLRLS